MSFQLPSRSCWPNAVQLDLLRAGLLRDDRAIAAWQRWVATAARHPGHDRLLPLAVWNLRELTGCAELTGLRPDPAHLTWSANRRLLDAVLPALGDLSAAAVPIVLLKGVALAATVYASLALRRIGDVDVLVGPRHLEPARELLRARGFVEVAPRATSARAHLHSFGFALPDGAAIDLHAFALYECAAIGFDDGFWSRRAPLLLRELATSTLAPCDHLLLLCAHGLRFSREPAIHWLADAALLIRAAGPALAWDTFVAEARSRRLEAPAGAALRLLRDELEAPVPPEVVDDLSKTGGRFLRRRELLARTNPPTLSGGLFLHWCDHRRLRSAATGGMQTPGFLRYLSDLWGLPGLRGLPSAALRKGWSRLRGAA